MSDYQRKTFEKISELRGNLDKLVFSFVNEDDEYILIADRVEELGGEINDLACAHRMVSNAKELRERG